MVREPIPTEINTVPDLAALAREVATTGERRVLTENGTHLAVISPARTRRSRRRPKPLTMDNPIWDIVGSIKEDVGTDVSSNKHKYLAEAYASESE